MRPKPHEGIPTPALRRYLNPTTPHLLSPTDLSTQVQGAPSPKISPASEKAAPMIQLQTYTRSPRSPRAPSSKQQRQARASADNTLSKAGRALALAIPAVRQREPRENSDFLRVVVLEMNMRRRGKLDAKAAGRARIWLPPRRMGCAGGGRERGRVPGRWVGVCVDEW